MSFMKKFSYSAATIALLAAAPAVVHAQQTTGSISGSVVSSSGGVVSDATVTVLHVPTGSARTAGVNASGSFSADNLRPGGPYIVTVSAPGFAGQRVEDVYVELGAATSLNLSLDAEATDVIVVTASAINAVEVAVGPSAVFTQTDLERLPSVNRTITDIVRTDPRIYVDEAFVDGIQCAGANSRFNSLTLDGVRINDGFGLNSNGFPTERQPFPFDSLSQVLSNWLRLMSTMAASRPVTSTPSPSPAAMNSTVARSTTTPRTRCKATASKVPASTLRSLTSSATASTSVVRSLKIVCSSS
jgi:hypothetical protein